MLCVVGGSLSCEWSEGLRAGLAQGFWCCAGGGRALGLGSGTLSCSWATNASIRRSRGRPWKVPSGGAIGGGTLAPPSVHCRVRVLQVGCLSWGDAGVTARRRGRATRAIPPARVPWSISPAPCLACRGLQCLSSSASRHREAGHGTMPSATGSRGRQSHLGFDRVRRRHTTAAALAHPSALVGPAVGRA